MKNLPQAKRVSAKEEDWIKRLDEHGFDLIRYIPGSKWKKAVLYIRCRKCGTAETLQTGTLTNRKIWCRGCVPAFVYSTESIKAHIELHGGTYLGGEVKDRNSRIDLICPNCQKQVRKRAQAIKRKPASCENCRVDLIRSTALKRAKHLKAAHALAKKRGGQCLTVDKLVAASDKLEWECALGHTWQATSTSVRNLRTWCPTCHSQSVGECTVRALMEGAFGVPFPNCHPKFLGGLQLDGFNADLNLAFEVNGIQHFHRNARYHRGEKDLRDQKARDRRKRKLCAKHGVPLLVLPYTVVDRGHEAIRPHLTKLLELKGFTPPHDLSEIELDMRLIYDPSSQPRFQQLKKAVLEKKGSFDLASYRGLTFPIEFRCKEGHSWTTRPYLVANGHWCPTCAGSAKLDTETIKNELAKEGWSLRQPFEYKNAHQVLPMACPNGHSVDRTWNAWQQKKLSCQQCNMEAAGQFYLVGMQERGITIQMSKEDYRNGQQEVAGVCNVCGHKQAKKATAWKLARKCSGCDKVLAPYPGHEKTNHNFYKA